MFFPRNDERGGLTSGLAYGLASAKSGPGSDVPRVQNCLIEFSLKAHP